MKKLLAFAQGNKGDGTLLLEVKAPVDVMVLVNGVKQAYCDPAFEAIFGEEIYHSNNYLLNVKDGSMVTIVGPDFQIAVAATMDNWQWVKVGTVEVDCGGTFNEAR